MERYGNNALKKQKSKGFFRKFFENLNDPIIKVLLIALILEVVLTFGACNWFEVGGIVIAILIATTVSTVSEYGSERAFERLESESREVRVRVLRGGLPTEILASEIVVGDVVYLSAGERAPADGVMIEGRITVDQSALNGESREVTKRPSADSGSWELSSESRVFRGTNITSGDGIMRVGRVGESTYYGMVAKDVQTETRKSPLKLRLSKLAADISRLGYLMALFVGLTYLFNTFVVDNGFNTAKILASLSDLKFLFASLIHALTLMITVVVVAVPEGLPMMITVVLSANMKKMVRDSVLVKKLVGIETAGSMNILFTDKTGTITTGRIECDRIITEGRSHKGLVSIKKSREIFEILTISAKYNTDVTVSGSELIGGNATDRAIAAHFLTEDCPVTEIREKVPFTSEKKYSAVTLKDGRVIIKGAPERIFSSAEYALGEDGVPRASDLSFAKREYNEATARGERAIAVAVSGGNMGRSLVFVALILLKDKLRKNVREAVDEVTRAGIQIVMITGDGQKTATAIATECGIFRPGTSQLAIGCDELARMSDGEIKEILPRIRVVYRALPQDKLRLVRLSQELDLVVGMTGDGINDAPSLKLADVGFSMGSGTDIAKEAGDVVILDDSFSAISKTVLYGRTIFKSIRKFIVFQLTMNLAACFVSLLGQFIGIDNPITIIQMLWVNIIMDTLGGLAFAGEAPLRYYMREKPKKRDEAILSKKMISQIAVTGAYTLALCTLFLRLDAFRESFGFYSFGETYFLTAFYALFIFSGIFNCFGARCERLWLFSNIGKNRAFIVIMALIAIIQLLMIYFGGSLFRSVPLSAQDLLKVIALAFTVIPFEMLRRIFAKLSKK